MKQDIPLLTWGQTRILFVMATDQEYGPELQKRMPPLIVGVGPVEAALGVADVLAAADPMPDLVVSLGSAGSNRLEQGTVHQVSAVSYRDMDASPLGFDKGLTPFLDQPAVIELAPLIKTLPVATLSTGANIVSGVAYNSIDADMVDMESFAIVRACQTYGPRFCGLRGISDGAEDLRHYRDWADYLPTVDRELAKALDLLKAQLEQGL